MSGVIQKCISDHFGVYAVVSSNIPSSSSGTNVISTRNLNNFNRDTFTSKIVNSDTFNTLNNICDVELAWNIWKKEYLRICNTEAPVRMNRIRKVNNPWFNHDILKLIYDRDYYHKLVLRNNNEEAWQVYRKTRNKVNREIRSAKKTYYSNKIKNSSTKPATLWKILRHLLPSKTSSYLSDLDPDTFNDFFCGIGENLTKHYDDLPSPFSTNSPTTTNTTFNLYEINSSSVLQSLLHLPPSNCLDLLGIDNYLLRIAAPAITKSLTHIFNLSLCLGVIPEDFKTARVTPVYKGKGDKSDPNNYRPISVVPTLAKILEKQVKIQLINYLSSNRLLSPSQSAYLPKHSTETALHNFMNYCLSNVDKQNINLVCALDLSKGFDTLNHHVLLKKLENHGIVNNELTWFRSYLSNRHQMVRLSHKTSHLHTLSMGVPQGTCLGPVLFLLYVNDLPSNIPSCLSIMYADDTTLISAASSLDEVKTLAQQSILAATNWFSINRLIVNSKKSNILFVGSTQKNQNINSDFTVALGSTLIDRSTEIKLLGVIMDQHLNFASHVSHLVKKISPKIALLHRLRHILDLSTLNHLYLSIVQSHFDYCITIWGNCPQTYLKQVQRLQNRAARAVLGNFDYSCSVSKMIRDLGWMTINQRYVYFTSILMYKCLNGMAPPYLSSLFHYVNSNTRSSSNNDLSVPRPHTEIFKRSLAYAGPKLWNKIPLSIREVSNMSAFKHHMRRFILNDTSSS